MGKGRLCPFSHGPYYTPLQPKDLQEPGIVALLSCDRGRCGYDVDQAGAGVANDATGDVYRGRRVYDGGHVLGDHIGVPD